MTTEEQLAELIFYENKFCESELEGVKNENGVFIYKSANGVQSINLPCVLRDYRDWLIEQGILYEKSKLIRG